MPLPTAATKKLHALTSLRFIAAASIMVHHSSDVFHLPITDVTPVAWRNGVSFFFVLSGFILTYVYGSRPEFSKGQFMLARVARVWPAHIAALVLYLVIVPHELWAGYGSLDWLANVTMTHTWFLAPATMVAFVAPSWSISTEFAFYWFFMLARDAWRRRWVWFLAGSALLVVIICVVSNKTGFAEPDQARALWVSSLVYLSPYARLFEFVLGMCTAKLWMRKASTVRLSKIRGSLLECGVLSVAFLTMMFAAPWSHAAARWFPSLGLGGDCWLTNGGFACLPMAGLIYVMALERGLVSRLLSSPVLVLLGEISYSVYLIHVTLLFCVSSHPAQFATDSWYAFPVFCLVTLSVAYLIWAFIERPCRRFLVGLWPGRTAPATTGPSAPVGAEETKQTAGYASVAVERPSWQGAVIAVVVLVASLTLVLYRPKVLARGTITMTPLPGTIHAGRLDKPHWNVISGWAWNSQNPTGTVTVEIYEGKKLLCKVKANLERQELLNQLGDACHGFSCETPRSLQDGQPHMLRARIAGTTTELDRSPRRLYCNENSDL